MVHLHSYQNRQLIRLAVAQLCCGRQEFYSQTHKHRLEQNQMLFVCENCGSFRRKCTIEKASTRSKITFYEYEFVPGSSISPTRIPCATLRPSVVRGLVNNHPSSHFHVTLTIRLCSFHKFYAMLYI